MFFLWKFCLKNVHFIFDVLFEQAWIFKYAKNTKNPYMQACEVKTHIVGLVLKGLSVHECKLHHTYNGNESFVCCIATFPSGHVSLLLHVGESQWRGVEVTLALMCKRRFICECASLVSTIVQAWLNTRSMKIKTRKLQVELWHFSHLSFFLQWWNRTSSVSRVPETVGQGIINSLVLSILASVIQ